MKTKKIISIIAVICMLFSFTVVSVGAETKSSTVSVDSSNSTDTTDSDSNTTDYGWSQNTTGNSEMIADQKVILDNGEYEFIAVTTRDKDVFYIIVDKTKAEDNVYFLNEVDTADIQKLISKRADNDDSNATNGTNSSSNDTSKSDENSDSTTTSTPSETQNSSTDDNNNLILLLVVGIVLLGGGAFMFIKIKHKKTSNAQSDNDFDFIEDDEINEDTEHNEDSKK